MLRPSVATLSSRFHQALGYWPDLDSPTTLQEKILWRKLFEDMSEATRLADKVAVRDYVREVIGEKYLNTALAIVESADQLDFESFPHSFVLKVNHAAGVNIVVRDRPNLNVPLVTRLLGSLLRITYGRRYGEHWYSEIEPRILVEAMLVDGEPGKPPTDYRFHVFHGQTEFIEVVTSKGFSNEFRPDAPEPMMGYEYVAKTAGTHTTYTREWQPAPFWFQGVPRAPSPDVRPAVADEMLAVAERLAGDWGYVRVDLYCIDNRSIYFGELTFAHGSGLFSFEPDHYNAHLGSLWDIQRRYSRRAG